MLCICLLLPDELTTAGHSEADIQDWACGPSVLACWIWAESYFCLWRRSHILKALPWTLICKWWNFLPLATPCEKPYLSSVNTKVEVSLLQKVTASCRDSLAKVYAQRVSSTLVLLHFQLQLNRYLNEKSRIKSLSSLLSHFWDFF